MCQWKSLIQRRPTNVNVYLLIIRVFFTNKVFNFKNSIVVQQSIDFLLWKYNNIEQKNIFCIVVMYHDSSIFWKQFASNSALADIKCYSYYGTKWNVNTPGNSLKFVHFVVVNGLQHFLIVLWSNRKKDRLIKTFNKGPSLVRIFYENIYGFKSRN